LRDKNGKKLTIELNKRAFEEDVLGQRRALATMETEKEITIKYKTK